MTEVTVRHLLTKAITGLPGDSPRLDAELLLAHALGHPRSWLFAHADDPLSPTQVAAAEALLQRRRTGEPIAHLLGQREFWSLPLTVTPATLIPRPDTELLVELALAHLPADQAATVLDLGAGTGAIALAIARERPRARLIATDASETALDVARANIARLVPGRIETRHGDWFAPVAGLRFDVIVSNPPYIPDDDPHLNQGDLRFEPCAALASGPDGLDAIRTIATGAIAHLTDGGWLLVEHGHDQGEAVRALFDAAGLIDIETARDLEQRERVTLGRWQPASAEPGSASTPTTAACGTGSSRSRRRCRDTNRPGLPHSSSPARASSTTASSCCCIAWTSWPQDTTAAPGCTSYWRGPTSIRRRWAARVARGRRMAPLILAISGTSLHDCRHE